MERRRDGQLFAIVALSIAVVFMSIGFAAFTQKLRIEGVAHLDKATWDVHFDKNTFYNYGIDSTTPTSLNSSGTTLTWETKLHQVGDYAEFSIEFVNKGTFDAKLKNVVVEASTEDGGNYLKPSVVVFGDKYEETTDVSNKDYILRAGEVDKVKVRLEYVQPENNILPTHDDTIGKMLVSLDFEQA